MRAASSVLAGHSLFAAAPTVGTFNRGDAVRLFVPTYATRALVSVLCELAADADPDRISVRLAATPAGDLRATDGPLELDPETPVLSEFYFPDAGSSLSGVFGMDLAAPTGQTAGRFVSHPDGDPTVSVTDDLHATVLVAVPPWDADDVRAYDRDDERLDLMLVDAETADPETPI